MELTHDFRQRTALLLGDERMARLQNARVAVFGLGGVGGACAEALCRAGVGRLTLVDNDTVSLSNINRQIVALHSTVGQPKTAALRARLLDINPACDIEEKNLFFDQSTADSIDFSAFDYVIDAIDTVSAKLLLVERARAPPAAAWRTPCQSRRSHNRTPKNRCCPPCSDQKTDSFLLYRTPG